MFNMIKSWISNFTVDPHKLKYPILSQDIVLKYDILYRIDENGKQHELSDDDIKILYWYHN